MNERPDATIIRIGEKKHWIGFKLTSGASQVDVTAQGFDASVTFPMTEEQALDLANDLSDRVHRMRKARAAEAAAAEKAGAQ